MSVRLNQESSSRAEPRAAVRRDSSVLQAILAELSAGLTYVTIAAIAYDLGQVERGSSLLAQAAAAHNYGRRLTSTLSGPSRETMESQLSSLADAVEDCGRGDSLFAPCLRQPSLS